MALSEKTRMVWDFLRAHKDEAVMASDIAAGTGLTARSVNGVINLGLAKKGLAERVAGQVEVQEDDGTTSVKDVKFIQLTAEGHALDPDAE